MTHPLTEALQQGVRNGVFPGAALLVQEGDTVHYCEAVGSAVLEPSTEPLTRETLFDLASLTKPVAAATAVMQLIGRNLLALEQPAQRWLPEFTGDGKEAVTLYHLLNHSSGLPAWKPFYKEIDPGEAGRPEITERLLQQIAREPLVKRPGEQSVYSDLGFILLGAIVARADGRALDRVAHELIFTPLGMRAAGYRPLDRAELAGRSIAATELCEWRGRPLRGEVHDENCFALGGVSGHAGLFAPIGDLAPFVGAVIAADQGQLRGPFVGVGAPLVRQFLTRQPTPGSSWALGWDTPSESSSSGRFFSPVSCGHLGYTGTSIWIDRERGWGVTLLTNRVHPTRRNVKISDFRPVLHDLVAREFFPGAPAS